jgi:rubrerythrin
LEVVYSAFPRSAYYKGHALLERTLRDTRDDRVRRVSTQSLPPHKITAVHSDPGRASFSLGILLGRRLLNDNYREQHTMADTTQNLKDAFAGESQANQKYLAFAEKAAKDGLPNIAKLFRTTAQAELIHAHGHLAAMGSIGSTAENLQAAIDGETYEYKDMYPPMLAQAEGEGHKAKRMFGYAVEAEAVHAKLYQMALEAAQRGEDLTETEFYLCPICGHIELGNPPDQCPTCGAKAAKFVQL